MCVTGTRGPEKCNDGKERGATGENRWPIGQKSCAENQFRETAPATSLSELEHDRPFSSLLRASNGKPTGFVHVRLLGILTSSASFNPLFGPAFIALATFSRTPGAMRVVLNSAKLAVNLSRVKFSNVH